MGKLKRTALTISAGALFLAMASCRPAPEHAEAEQTTAPSPPAENERATLPDAGNDSAAFAPAAPETAEEVAALEQRYASEADLETRAELIAQLGESEQPAAIDALTRMFQNERETDLKLAQLEAAMARDDLPEQRLGIFAAGLSPSQPQAVRLLALEGASLVQTPAAVALLQGLRLDADEEVRGAAAEVLESPADETPP